jgi:hypothetical protein
MSERYAQLKVSAQEVYGSDVPDLLLSGQCDLALAPLRRSRRDSPEARAP